MKFNNKSLQRVSRLVNYSISFLLCVFLVSLSSKLIDDVADWNDVLPAKSFENRELIDSLEQKISGIETEIESLDEQLSTLRKTQSVVQSQYVDAKASYENWLSARKVVGSPNEDEDVLSRARDLDELFKTKQNWDSKYLEIQAIQDSLLQLQKQVQDLVYAEQDRAYDERTVAVKANDVQVFLIRLLFILPLFALSIFFILKYRSHKYWPIFLGYILFAFYVFFFGLVPYLPSYGGYIRYGVGIVVVVFFGVFAINKIKGFVERKWQELEESTDERAKKLDLATVEKALDNHMCPSCGKDFLLKKWKSRKGKKQVSTEVVAVSHFCRFCGLELFSSCKVCGKENYAHLPFCSHCGVKV